jgi:hypothetical protein
METRMEVEPLMEIARCISRAGQLTLLCACDLMVHRIVENFLAFYDHRNVSNALCVSYSKKLA